MGDSGLKQGKNKSSKKRKKKSQITKKNTKKKIKAKSGKKNSIKKKNSTAKKKNSTIKKDKSTVKKEQIEKVKEQKEQKEKKVSLQERIALTKKVVSFFKNVKNKLKSITWKKENKNKKEKKKVKKQLLFNKRLSTKTIRVLSLCSIFCLILALVLMFPFGITNYKSEASGKILDIPKFSILSEECCMYNATFKSIRSYSSLKAEIQTIFSQYEKINCEGKDYFYSEKEDFTITDYGLKKGLIFSEYYVTYSKGNVCEVDSTLKNIELLPDHYSLEAAKMDGCYVINNGEEFNVSSYNQFLKDIEEGKESTLRIVTTTSIGDVIITDLKHLSDGKFKVIYDGTRDRENVENNRVMMAYVYENIGIYKDKFYAYNGNAITSKMLETSDVYYLFDVIGENESS